MVLCGFIGFFLSKALHIFLQYIFLKRLTVLGFFLGKKKEEEGRSCAARWVALKTEPQAHKNSLGSMLFFS